MPIRTRRAPDAIPSMKLHAATGRSVVYLDGRSVYLGTHGKPETRRRYDRLLAEWLANDRQLPEPDRELTVDELADRYEAHHRDPAIVRAALKLPRRLYGPEPLSVLRPLALKALLRQWAGDGLSITTANGYAKQVRQAVRFAVSNEWADADQLEALRSVTLLRPGRGEGKEPRRVKPVAWEQVEAIRPHVASAVWAMVIVQWETGARAGEVVGLTPADLDMSSEVWVVDLDRHKTSYQGHRRRLLLPRAAQEAISPFLTDRRLDAPLWNPREAAAEMKARTRTGGGRREGQGLTPTKTDRRIGTRYRTDTYRQAIERGCDAAGIDKWTPHRLRHSAATRFRREFGVDVAATILGHSSAALTDAVYAERDYAKAAAAMGGA
ncbi:MAG: site-specific integrase [Planctomycetota bacterium]